MAKKKSTGISKGRSPAFQYYPDKYDTHTRHLSDYSYRVYHRIINWMWLHSPDYCSCPDDNAAIAILLAEPVTKISEAIKEIQNEHMPLFRTAKGKYVSGGLKKEALKQKANSDRARANAEKRWTKTPDAVACKTDATALQLHSHSIDAASSVQCSPTPSPIPTPATPIKKKSVCIDPAIKARVGGWFGRRESTKWSDKEVKALKALGDITEDLDQMEALYKSGDTYNRKQIQTLLNNWQGEMDRARQYIPKASSRPVDVGGNRDASGKPIFQC